ncbi:MAG TPA: tyrosine-type recombinase/integrase [Methanocorpusculum sp.]|nr:tyrosine-type recombinase/integrase [Methanocorpusculum sp.]
MVEMKRTFGTWIPRYLSNLQNRDFSANTIAAYRRILVLFAKYEEYCSAHDGVAPEHMSDFTDLGLSANIDVSSFEIEDFFTVIRNECHLSPTSIRQYNSAMSSFYKYLVKQDIMDVNPMDKVDRPKSKDRELKYLRHKEVMEFIEKLKQYGNGNRNSLIVRTIYATGMRISEICSMEVSHINFEEGTIKVLHGKGDKFRVVFCDSDTLQLISEYLDGRNSGPVFESTRGVGISARMVQHFFNLYAPEGITPHKIRHSYASELYSRSHNIRVVQENLGHTSIKTTEIYVHTNISERKESYQQYFPLANGRS